MSLSKKTIRQIVDYTFLKVDADPKNWFDRARQFNSVTNLIYQNTPNNLTPAYYFNAGLSLELALKAVIIAKSKSFQKVHTLNDLLKKADITLSEDQECTLELLSEIIIWRGRYPTPKTEDRWDKYYDNILEKHMIRQQDGNISRVVANKQRFPSQENYNILWGILENEFNSLVNQQS